MIDNAIAYGVCMMYDLHGWTYSEVSGLAVVLCSTGAPHARRIMQTRGVARKE